MASLKRGSTGPEVMSIQTRLKALGFKVGRLDGYFGPRTEAAVKEFQKVHGLFEDGMVGSRTMSALPQNELDLPLNLFEILEEEYMSLYGKLENEKVIKLKKSKSKKAQTSNANATDDEATNPEQEDSEITSGLDWDFRTGHIKNWKAFKGFLLNERNDLIEPLKVLLSPAKVSTWDTEGAAILTLNQLLGECFYRRVDFRHVKFSESTEKLFELYPKKDQGEKVAPNELRQMNRLLLEDLFPEHLASISEIRLAAIYQIRHEKKPGALCFSGGGIRSGTFGLGLLQGLARHNLLNEFDYLSTVSGGGYIGAWLTAWIYRHPKPLTGLEGVTSDLTNAKPQTKIDPDPQALRHLREYSNFLTPKAGLLSADTWTFLAIYVRNLILNWSVLIPLLLAFLLIPRLKVALILADPASRYGLLLLPFGCVVIVYAITYIGLSRPSLRPLLIQNSPWLKDRMGQRGFLVHGLFPLILAGSVLTTFWAWRPERLVEWGPLVVLGAALAASALFVSILFIGALKEIIFGSIVLVLTGLLGGQLVWMAERNTDNEWPFLAAGLVTAALLLVVAVLGKRKMVIVLVLLAIIGVFVSLLFWAVRNSGDGWLLLGAGLTAVTLLILFAKAGNQKEIIGGAILILTGIFVGLLIWVAGKLINNQAGDVDQTWTTEIYAALAVPVFLLLFMMAATIFAGISSHLLGLVTEEDREWWSRFSGWILISAGAWVVFSTLVIFGPLGLLQFPKLLGALGGISGLVAIILGKSAKTAATNEKGAQGGLMSYLSSYLLPLLAILFLAIFLGALSLLTSTLTPSITKAVANVLATTGGPTPATVPGSSAATQPVSSVARPTELLVNRQLLDAPFTTADPAVEQPRLPVEISNTRIGELLAEGKTSPAPQRQVSDAAVQHMRAIHFPRWLFFLGLMVVLLLLGILLARAINLNLFSLHNSYRSRLIRGFLAASRGKKHRAPNPFTGFDPADNVSMHELRPALLHEVDFKDLDGFANELRKGGQTLAQRVTAAGSKEPTGEVKPASPSEYIYAELSKKGKAAVDDSKPPTPLAPNQRVDLIEDLNRILEADRILLDQASGFADPAAAAAAEAEAEAQKVSTTPKERQYRIHANRLALESKFADFIERTTYPPHRLFHVINTTLNLVGGDNLAWQQRKAESFTVSPLHCGSSRVGYRRSRDYGGDDGISLGTAMAISGAAASSNMGYYTTSPVLSLVLTLFNVRLGWWLGNPGPAGSRTYTGLQTDDRPGEGSKKIYRRMSPTFSIGPVFSEAFGLTDDRSEYVYLTDGGHFENLGLYEMVLRRCHLIVVSDAAADANYEFNDLANAVRKVRIDLGIHIQFPDVPIYAKKPDKQGEGGCYWSVGLIRYSDIDYKSDGETKADDGLLIYIKPAVYDDEPEDVMHYKRTHPDFPNETTADQFFDEPQFESYRALGSYIMDQMCGSHDGTLTIEQFVAKAKENFFRLAPQAEKKYIGVFPKITPDDADSAPDKKAVKPETPARGGPTQTDIKDA